MNGVVLLRVVSDTEAPASQVRMLLDAPSLVALSQALDWRRSAPGRVIGLAAGPASWEPALREALALGLDEVTRIHLPEEIVDTLTTARLIAGALSDADLVFAGSRASDHGGGLLPSVLAGVLDWPLMSEVISARFRGGDMLVDVRAGPGRVRTYAVGLPVVLSAARLQPPPLYPPLARRLAAARAEIASARLDLGDASVDGPLQFLGYAGAHPRTKRLLRPDTGARAGDRLSQLMSAGAKQRAGAQIGGDARSLAHQLADILEKSGFLVSNQ